MICSFTFSKESIVCYGFIKYLRENRKHALGKNIFIHLIIHKAFYFQHLRLIFRFIHVFSYQRLIWCYFNILLLFIETIHVILQHSLRTLPHQRMSPLARHARLTDNVLFNTKLLHNAFKLSVLFRHHQLLRVDFYLQSHEEGKRT